MPQRPPALPVYRERGALQTLVGKGWLPAANLYPAGPSTIINMMTKGWLERRKDVIFGWVYQITASGEEALRAPLPIAWRLKKSGKPRGRPSK